MIRKVLGSLVVSFLLLAALEGTLSIGEIVYRGVLFQRDDWYILSRDLGWVNRPNFSGEWFERGRNPRGFDDRGFASLDTQQLATDNNRSRIIALGDSSTFGWGIRAEHTFTEVLDKQLPDFDIINFGVLGYSSFQGSQRFLKQGLALHPTLIIASFNFNDRRAVPSAHDIDSEATFARYVMATRLIAVKQLYVSKALTRVLRRLGLIQIRDASGSEEIIEDVRTLHARVPPESYRENLVKIAQTAKERHIPVIFLVLGDNPIQTEHLRKGIKFLDQSHYDSAINELSTAVREHNLFSLLAQKYLAQAYERMGRLAEARETLQVEKNVAAPMHGGLPVYLDTEYQSIMRDVAHDYSVNVVEASQELDKDPSVYLDNCHPNELEHAIIAHLLHEAVNDIMDLQRSAS